jgi:hypothetical protein
MQDEAREIIPSIAYDRFKALDVEGAGRISEICVTLAGTLSPKAADIIRCGLQE